MTKPIHQADDRQPIFILGMLQRTGTNHLWDLFGLHPDVELLEPVFEDHLIRWSPHLEAYVEDVTRCWSPEWEVPEAEATNLMTAIGGGLASWLADRSERRVVTKMPSVEKAENFIKLLPDCPLVVIVRDGRSVSQSGVTSFGWSYERAFRRWNAAAEIVLDLQRQHKDNPHFAVVRFEDVVDKPAQVMDTLCRVTGLNADQYPFDEVEALPVRGSSTLRSDDDAEEIHWAPQARTQEFDPRERWRTWDDHLHRRFAAVAGASQSALGYELEPTSGTDSLKERASDMVDLLDVRFRETRVKVGRARRSVRRVHGRI